MIFARLELGHHGMPRLIKVSEIESKCAEFSGQLTNYAIVDKSLRWRVDMLKSNKGAATCKKLGDIQNIAAYDSLVERTFDLPAIHFLHCLNTLPFTLPSIFEELRSPRIAPFLFLLRDRGSNFMGGQR